MLHPYLTTHNHPYHAILILLSIYSNQYLAYLATHISPGKSCHQYLTTHISRRPYLATRILPPISRHLYPATHFLPPISRHPYPAIHIPPPISRISRHPRIATHVSPPIISRHPDPATQISQTISRHPYPPPSPPGYWHDAKNSPPPANSDHEPSAVTECRRPRAPSGQAGMAAPPLPQPVRSAAPAGRCVT